MDSLDAIKKLDDARKRILVQYPFWEIYLLKVKFIPSKHLPSISMGLGLRVRFNSDYVERKTVRELAGILICFLLQKFLDQGSRGKGKHPFVWMLASALEVQGDYEDGRTIGLPAESVVPSFYSFPPRLTAEEYYSMLIDLGQIPLPFTLRNSDGEEVFNGQKFYFDPTQEPTDLPALPGSELLQGGYDDFLEMMGQEDWEDDGENPQVEVELDPIFDMIQRMDTRKRIKDYNRSRPGKLPDYLLFEAGVATPQLDWKEATRRLVRKFNFGYSGKTMFDYSFYNPLEEMLPDGFMLQGHKPVGREVLVLLDTSGSMNPDHCANALGEIDGLLRVYSGLRGIKVMPCDATPKPVQLVRAASQVELIGRGGTEMSVGLKAVLKIRPRPSLVIVLTDGQTTWPSQPITEFPIIVVIVSQEWSFRYKKKFPVPKWLNLVEMFPRSKKSKF